MPLIIAARDVRDCINNNPLLRESGSLLSVRRAFSMRRRKSYRNVIGGS